MIQVSINDKRSLGSWCIKETNESTLGKESDLGSLIQIPDLSKGMHPVLFKSYDDKSEIVLPLPMNEN